MNNSPLEPRYTDWQEWLDGNLPEGQVDNNSVAGVVYSLVQEMAIHEAYLELCQKKPNSHLATGLFFRSSMFTYFEIQALRIRRLTEKNPNSTARRNVDVYSLRRIVDDLREQQKLKTMTRRNICLHFGYPTTAKSTEKQYSQFMATLRSGSFSTHLIDAGNLHKTLAIVCTKSGLLSSKFIKELESRASEAKNQNIKDVNVFVDKYIAHSSSDGSRQQVAQEVRLETDKVKDVIQGIVECFYLLEMFIKRASYASLIPFGWDVHLNNLDSDEKQIVQDKFKEIDDLCTEWRTNAYELLND
jgi:hypothetical protein